MVEAVRKNVLPASRLPKVIEAWEDRSTRNSCRGRPGRSTTPSPRCRRAQSPGADGREPPALIALSEGVVPQLNHCRGRRILDGPDFLSPPIPAALVRPGGIVVTRDRPVTAQRKRQPNRSRVAQLLEFVHVLPSGDRLQRAQAVLPSHRRIDVQISGNVDRRHRFQQVQDRIGSQRVRE